MKIAQKPVTRIPYHRPEVKDYGTISKITAGVGTNRTRDSMSSTMT
jgi:hypothetical protein